MAGIERIKLYHFPLTRSARVKWLLHELVGDDFELEIVSLYDGAQHSEGFLAMNPNHAVPVVIATLADGSEVTLFESGAIITWLADAYPEKALAPAPGPTSERADYLKILHFAASWFDMMLWQIRVHQDLTPAKHRPEAIIESFRKKIRREVEPQVEQRLAEGGFATGTSFSAADCVLAHDVRWARLYGLCEQPIFDQYLERMAERPAYAAAFADAGDFEPIPPALR